DALARDFIEHGFDIRRLERTILQSRAYQLSSKTTETNRLDHTNFSHCVIRPMMAEVVVDVFNSALGGLDDSISKGTPDVLPGVACPRSSNRSNPMRKSLKNWS